MTMGLVLDARTSGDNDRLSHLSHILAARDVLDFTELCVAGFMTVNPVLSSDGLLQELS